MIILAGMIGVGKTTYTYRLAEELGTQPFFEPVEENPILDKYYEDPDKYGFALQIYFLNKRFKMIKAAYHDDNNILDRSIYEDALFTYINTLKGSISEQEYDIYLELLDNMMEEIQGLPKKAPDLLIYLDGSFDHIMNNIKNVVAIMSNQMKKMGSLTTISCFTSIIKIGMKITIIVLK